MRESVRRSVKYTFGSNILTGPVAQRLEQGTHNPLVVGSNPTGPTMLRMSKSESEGESVDVLTITGVSSEPAQRVT